MLGKSPAEARHLHLLLTADVLSLADSTKNPPERWIYKLRDTWRKNCFGNVSKIFDFIKYAFFIILL
jgi:hypothetical protein